MSKPIPRSKEILIKDCQNAIKNIQKHPNWYPDKGKSQIKAFRAIIKDLEKQIKDGLGK